MAGECVFGLPDKVELKKGKGCFDSRLVFTLIRDEIPHSKYLVFTIYD